MAIDLTAEQRAGGAADDQPGRSARPAAIAMTRPIIATIPIMAAAIIAAIVAPVVPAVIVAVLIMGVTVMAIARLRLTRHGGHGAHTEKRRQGQFLPEHRSTLQSGPQRSEERRVGKESGSTIRTRWW